VVFLLYALLCDGLGFVGGFKLVTIVYLQWCLLFEIVLVSYFYTFMLAFVVVFFFFFFLSLVLLWKKN